MAPKPTVGGAMAAQVAEELAFITAERERLKSERAALPPVAEFLAGRHVLITGGSGFLGRLLVEMLLRCCPDIGNIYLVLRTRRGVAPADRLQTLLDVPLFERLLADQPDALSKLVVLPGDITELKLGLSEEHQQLVKAKVSLIYHLAASVRFDDPFQKAVFTNLRSTREVVELARGMPQLKVLMHVSTAYTNINRTPVEERVYNPDHDWRDVIRWAEELTDQEALDVLGPKLMGFQPNSYTFTKALAEKVIDDVADELPVIITRPSIVVATYQDPIPGWIDNLYGLCGFWAGGFKGIVRVVRAPNIIFDSIPADVVTKQVLLASWLRGIGRTIRPVAKGTQVVNVTVGNHVGITFDDMSWVVSEEGVGRVVPYPGAVRPPKFSVSNCKVWAALMTFYHHVLFGFLVDCLARAAHKKPRVLKIYRRTQAALNAMSPFMNEYVFEVNNGKLLQSLIHPQDEKNLCYLSLSACRNDIHTFRRLVADSVRGILKYTLKEEDNPEKNWKHIARLKWVMAVYHSTMAILFCGILYCLFSFRISVQPVRSF